MMEGDTENRIMSRKERFRKVLIENLLIVMMIVAVAVGIGLGIGLREHWSPNDKRKLHFLTSETDQFLFLAM